MMRFERLKAWQACMELWVGIYETTQSWPRREWYGLAAQIRDAANSAGSNLAEGVAKSGLREMRRHTNIALGSLAEVAHQLMAARRVGILSEDHFSRLAGLQRHAGRLTWLLLRGISRRLGAKERGVEDSLWPPDKAAAGKK